MFVLDALHQIYHLCSHWFVLHTMADNCLACLYCDRNEVGNANGLSQHQEDQTNKFEDQECAGGLVAGAAQIAGFRKTGSRLGSQECYDMGISIPTSGAWKGHWLAPAGPSEQMGQFLKWSDSVASDWYRRNFQIVAIILPSCMTSTLPLLLLSSWGSCSLTVNNAYR